ncbi:hypothetical protein [Tepiditoga spiralis]|uniref:hypothetical protein n=1 Tax=Tepiditoga spiralis TaxID=2108365 RepID=UPI003B84A787
MQFRKTKKIRAIFSNKNSLMKILCLAMHNATKKYSDIEIIIISELYIIFENRFLRFKMLKSLYSLK